MKKLKLHDLEKQQLSRNEMKKAGGGTFPDLGELSPPPPECFYYGSYGDAKIATGDIPPPPIYDDIVIPIYYDTDIDVPTFP